MTFALMGYATKGKKQDLTLHPVEKQQNNHAYADNPNAVLYNSAGLPASPFVAVLPAARP
ncbi:hypothetical protein EOE67_17350 [Rheinheimera riviphila]|uniref:Uncharacterized protein n=1 Tax=Rheinheimera riviphila TaxID=1834037 RepID=A0A437QG91_9GAMM|nr:hypothetical protein [Rheinheimera riviphila]RVU33360.1 hypothetical protein EOE67_17350 [Rheinheimera riviphila]